MPLAAGTRIGPYEIVSPIGAGGMGEVYRARDTKLNRVVAIKAVQELFAASQGSGLAPAMVERNARFDREAQLLASINHPNIAAIYGVEESQGSKFLVLEFVDGRPLSEVLQGGALPVREALPIAAQIAEALAAAHERGIIHRDLKPGNVMVTAEGQVKVLDFGLGKALESEASSSASNSPTMTLAATQQGLILGTAGYMSPEQAKGRAADKRSDVWAFGVVLYEMVTGKRAFEGEDVTETLAAIVRGEPDWTAVPAGVPPQIRTLVERCLVKDRAQRLSDMSVVRFLLSDSASGARAPDLPATQATARGRSIGLITAAALVVLAVAATVAVMRFWPAGAPANTGAVRHLSIVLPDGDQLSTTAQLPLAVSSDGTTIAYTATHDGIDRVYIRQLSAPDTKMLAGTEGARSPFFSPDGQWVAFFAQGKLKKVAVSGAGLQALADASGARGGYWGADGHLYFAPTAISGIWRVSEAGGTASEVTHLDSAQGEISHRWPVLLPGNESLLFGAWTGPGNDEHSLAVQSLATGARRLLMRGGDMPRYLPAGYLLYGRLDGLFALPWRASDASVPSGAPVTLPETPRLENEGALGYAIADDGTLVYLAGGAARYAQQVVWVDRSGKTESLPLPARDYQSVAISPDGKQAAIQIAEGLVGIWLYDVSHQTMAPFATGNGSSQAAVWSPDGKRIIYRGTRNGFRNLFSKSADGTGAEERLTTKDGVSQTPTSISPDGQWLVFVEQGRGTLGDGDLWILRLSGDRPETATPQPFLQTPAAEVDGRLSPDGHWIAYQSDVSGRFEVYVQPFPGPGPRRQVSTAGGTEPIWARDGREIFYQQGDRLMVADLAAGPAFSPSAPRRLFEGRYKAAGNGNTAFDVAPDGRRFLRIQQTEPERPLTQLDVVLNWFTDLKRAGAAK